MSTDSQNSPEDTKHFSLDLPPGRVFDALNGIVRAHGTMVWTMGHANQEGFEVILSLIVGTSGVGFGVPRGRVARREPSSVMAVSHPRSAGNVPVALLDRIVGTRRDGQPLILRDLSEVTELADAVGVPMGVEMLPRNLRLAGLPGFSGFPATGFSLRYVLQTLIALDLGYEWREMNGVIVFRPVDAWADANDPLYRLVNNVRLADASTAEPSASSLPSSMRRRITALLFRILVVSPSIFRKGPCSSC